MADSAGEEFADPDNLTDGFNLVIDALKLNDINTISVSYTHLTLPTILLV